MVTSTLCLRVLVTIYHVFSLLSIALIECLQIFWHSYLESANYILSKISIDIIVKNKISWDLIQISYVNFIYIAKIYIKLIYMIVIYAGIC